jgi:cytochrome c
MMVILRRFVAIAVAGLVAVPAVTAAQEKGTSDKPVTEVIDLIGCTLCHQTDNRILGPSFKEVATKYKGDKEALNRTAERIVKGSKGVWGEVAMPANKISDEEARRIAAWILAR